MDDDRIAPAELHMIRDLETLRTIADPLRMQIYEQLIDTPLTVKALAARLGLSPSRLYYHMNVLEEHGLIRVVDQNIVGNLVEKIYRAVASKLDIAPELLSFDTTPGKESLATMVTSALDATRDDMLRSLEARTVALASGAPARRGQFVMTRTMQHIPEARAEELQERMKALLAEFDAAAVDQAYSDGEAHAYAVTIAFYPHFDYPQTEEGDV